MRDSVNHDRARRVRLVSSVRSRCRGCWWPWCRAVCYGLRRSPADTHDVLLRVRRSTRRQLRRVVVTAARPRRAHRCGRNTISLRWRHRCAPCAHGSLAVELMGGAPSLVASRGPASVDARRNRRAVLCRSQVLRAVLSVLLWIGACSPSPVVPMRRVLVPTAPRTGCPPALLALGLRLCVVKRFTSRSRER